MIQVGGFNFVKDLPRFLVLLYALQRFESSDWGRNSEFTVHESLAKDKIEKYTVVLEDKFTFTLKPISNPRLAIKGRATAVMEASCDQLPDKRMVAKLYWAEEARRSEVDILKQVEEDAKNIPAIEGHVPDLLFWREFRLSTATVRHKLHFGDTSNIGSRKFRCLVFGKLQPIKELQDNELFSAWRQCVLCKFNCLLLFLVLKVTYFKVTTPFGRKGSIIETLVVKT